MRKLLIFVAMVAMFSGVLFLVQGKGVTAGIPVHMIVTVEALRGTQVPELSREDVIVRQDKNRLREVLELVRGAG